MNKIVYDKYGREFFSPHCSLYVNQLDDILLKKSQLVCYAIPKL